MSRHVWPPRDAFGALDSALKSLPEDKSDGYVTTVARAACALGNDDETAAITAFLLTLTGQQPQVDYPVLPPHTDRTPPPDPEGMRAAH